MTTHTGLAQGLTLAPSLLPLPYRYLPLFIPLNLPYDALPNVPRLNRTETKRTLHYLTGPYLNLPYHALHYLIVLYLTLQ